jgi:glycosyltransferase involved in cell wall biosynthesis
MQIIHTKILRTFSGKGHAFIVPSTRGLAFYRQAGWPDQKLFYKPHFVNDPIKSRDTSFPERERTILFVGRLSAEKGVCELLEAWAQLETDWTLTIVGTGVLEHKLRDTYASLKNVVWRGWCAGEEVHRLMQAARFLIAPSIWHEPFGMVAVEALACGTPVLASNRGGFTDIVVDEENGVLFEPSSALIKTVLHRVFDQDDRQWFNWAKQAREAYLKHYQPEDSYARLIEIYEAAKVNSKTGFPPARE